MIILTFTHFQFEDNSKTAEEFDVPFVHLNLNDDDGEHSDIMEAVQAELDKMAVHEDRFAILSNWPEGDNDNAS